jgi:DNA-binding NtrC family response regulator
MSNLSSVLAIDDEREILESLSLIFEAKGTKKVCRATNSREAFEFLKNESFTVIIADYHMHGMSGVEFLEKLRSDGNQTPVVMLSGALDSDAIMRATQLPKVEFLAKPFQIPKLFDAIEKLLNLDR